MFDGVFIGKLDKTGKEIHCGDTVSITEKRYREDYKSPILDFENGTFELPKTEYIAKVKGEIKYDKDFCAFMFFPFDGTECHYYRKSLHRYEYIEIMLEE